MILRQLPKNKELIQY